MTLVYITHHNENIAGIEKHLFPEILRDRRSFTKFQRDVKANYNRARVIPLDSGKLLITSSNRCKNETMGYAAVPLREPCQFLRKHEGLQWCRERQHECFKKLRQPIPRFERGCTAPPRQVPDFIAKNIEYVTSIQPTRYAPRYVDSVRGDTHNLLNTGLVPQYVCRQNYGKVPCYLRYRKNYLKKMRRQCDEQMEQRMRYCETVLGRRRLTQMTANERHNILAGLKTNHAAVMKDFQKMALPIGNMGRKVRKNALENELRQLEQDIFLIENNPIIYVSNY